MTVRYLKFAALMGLPVKRTNTTYGEDIEYRVKGVFWRPDGHGAFEEIAVLIDSTGRTEYYVKPRHVKPAAEYTAPTTAEEYAREVAAKRALGIDSTRTAKELAEAKADFAVDCETE